MCVHTNRVRGGRLLPPKSPEDVVIAHLCVAVDDGHDGHDGHDGPATSPAAMDRILSRIELALVPHDVTSARDRGGVVVSGSSAAVMDALEDAHLSANAIATRTRSDITFLPTLPRHLHGLGLGSPGRPAP